MSAASRAAEKAGTKSLGNNHVTQAQSRKHDLGRHVFKLEVGTYSDLQIFESGLIAQRSRFTLPA
jgi:hypothetical protein